MKTLGIFGTAGFAREVDDVAHALGWRGVFVARDEAERAAWDGDEEVLVESELLQRAPALPCAIGIADPATRQAVARRYAGRLEFVTLIHPAASFGKRQREAVEARRGVVVAAGARFMSRIEVGDFTAFDLNVTIGHDCVIEDFAHFAPGANVSGQVHVGARCWIGTGAAINQGREGRRLAIGADTVVGSGAVVVRDCEAGAVYAGCPARRIRDAQVTR